MNAGEVLSDRVAEPISLVLQGYVWYLYAFCRLREDNRIFRLSRIKQLTVLPDPFAPRGDSLEDLDARWEFQEELRLVSLVLHFSKRVRVRVEDYFERAEIEGQSDGSLFADSYSTRGAPSRADDRADAAKRDSKFPASTGHPKKSGLDLACRPPKCDDCGAQACRQKAPHSSRRNLKQTLSPCNHFVPSPH